MDLSVSQDDINLELKNTLSSPVKEAQQQSPLERLIESSKFGELAKSDIVEEEGNAESKVRAALRTVVLPELKKISRKELENDMFTVMISPPVIRYVATAFFTIATIGSMIF